jgi:hypothetical protein
MNEHLFAVSLASDKALTLPPRIMWQIAIRDGQVSSPEEEAANFSAASLLLILPLVMLGTLVRRVLGRSVPGVGRQLRREFTLRCQR